MNRFDYIPEDTLEEIIEDKKRRGNHGFYNTIYGLYGLTLAYYFDRDLYDFSWRVSEKLNSNR